MNEKVEVYSCLLDLGKIELNINSRDLHPRYISRMTK